MRKQVLLFFPPPPYCNCTITVLNGIKWNALISFLPLCLSMNTDVPDSVSDEFRKWCNRYAGEEWALGYLERCSDGDTHPLRVCFAHHYVVRNDERQAFDPPWYGRAVDYREPRIQHDQLVPILLTVTVSTGLLPGETLPLQLTLPVAGFLNRFYSYYPRNDGPMMMLFVEDPNSPDRHGTLSSLVISSGLNHASRDVTRRRSHENEWPDNIAIVYGRYRGRRPHPPRTTEEGCPVARFRDFELFLTSDWLSNPYSSFHCIANMSTVDARLFGEWFDTKLVCNELRRELKALWCTGNCVTFYGQSLDDQSLSLLDIYTMCFSILGDRERQTIIDTIDGHCGPHRMSFSLLDMMRAYATKSVFCGYCGARLCRTEDLIANPGHIFHFNRYLFYCRLLLSSTFSDRADYENEEGHCEDSWFSGFAWIHIECTCGSPLGWKFMQTRVARASSFFGFISNRVVIQ
jgi:hypothetical protein